MSKLSALPATLGHSNRPAQHRARHLKESKMPSPIQENLARARHEIDFACAKSGRLPQSVELLAATKAQPVEKIQEAISCGVKACGENYLQEAEKKISEIGQSVQWHFIGHLQSNKAKKAVELFDCIQSVDSIKLAKKIDSAASKPFPVFIEVNIAQEKSKFGVSPANIPALFSEISKLSNLEVRGLFCMAPFLEPAQVRPHFKKMKSLAAQLGLSELSMGMSNDFPVAVEEGSTTVRLGTALFGKREK